MEVQHERKEPWILRTLRIFPSVDNYLDNLKYIDELTGLYRQRYFNDILRTQYAQTASYREDNHRRHRIIVPDLSLLFGDLDNFHLFNRMYGQLRGNEALHNVGDTIRRNKRPGDIAGRLGGEEMGILLPNTEHQEALVAAEKFRHLVEAESEGLVTMSFGAATFTPRNPNMASSLELHNTAENAMKLAKVTGGNRVCGMYELL